MTRSSDFATLLRRVAHGVVRLERDNVCCGITLQQFETMRAIADSGVLQNGQVAARLGIDLSTASRNLQVLERDGYVRRVAIKGDGRRVGNRLTAKGNKCMETLACDERMVFDGVLSRVAAEQRDEVRRALAALADALEPAPSDGEVCCSPVKSCG